jgi:hypothetical protein
VGREERETWKAVKEKEGPFFNFFSEDIKKGVTPLL